MARLSEQAERYGDMIEYIKRVTSMGPVLSIDERNLLSIAFKNSVGALRSAWRTMYASEQREAASGNPATLELIKNYRLQVENELNTTCNDVISILTNALVPNAQEAEAKVFYLKMKGDYYRYLAEFTVGGTHDSLANEAHGSYKTAYDLAMGGLEPANPIRLGLALNFSVFYHEGLAAPDKACALAQAAFDDATKGIEGVPADMYKESSAIMQLLQNNLLLWATSAQGGDGKAPEQDGTAVEEL